ncbi:hypothetical protein ACTMTI_44565 [Nonomuraea sp. H19]
MMDLRLGRLAPGLDVQVGRRRGSMGQRLAERVVASPERRGEVVLHRQAV